MKRHVVPEESSDASVNDFDPGFSFDGFGADYQRMDPVIESSDSEKSEESSDHQVEEPIVEEQEEQEPSQSSEHDAPAPVEQDPSSSEEEDEAEKYIDVTAEPKPEEEASEESSEAPPIPTSFTKVIQPEKTKQIKTLAWIRLHLSKPLLMAVSDKSFVRPTPVQAQAIPMALAGHDMAVSAFTGSGKTAAFVLPVLQRLHLAGQVGGGCVTILSPTRELAAQIFSVVEDLAVHTRVRSVLITGGLSVAAQAAALRTEPAIVVATPGRLIDHHLNTPSFSLGGTQILILDEADKLLQMGFRDELEIIIKACPKSRQTMLFSATMTDDVKDLARLSLRKPVRLTVDPPKQVNPNLSQEFIVLRQGNEKDRDAVVLSLLARDSALKGKKTMVFTRTKKAARRLRVLLSLVSVRSLEMHGDLTQRQRLDALADFREATAGDACVMVCTDVAARGIDVDDVEVVLQYDCARNLDEYIHRVGRTARASRSGLAVCVMTFKERTLLKQIEKHRGTGSKALGQRKVGRDVIAAFKSKIADVKQELEARLAMDEVDREAAMADRSLAKAENMMLHQDEIMARPRRAWFQSEAEKNALKKLAAKQFFDGHTTAEAAEKDEKAKRKARLHRHGLSAESEAAIRAVKRKVKAAYAVGERYELPTATRKKRKRSSSGDDGPNTKKVVTEEDRLKAMASRMLSSKTVKGRRVDKKFHSRKRYKRR